MKSLVQIRALYLKIDRILEQERTGADEPAKNRIEAQQVLNDQAYYILCWGQLETEIVEVCRNAIRHRINDSDWQVRRSWYLYNPENKQLSGLSFEDRLALVVDRSAGKGSPWAKTMFHYATRNDIAHGILCSTRIDIEAFVQDCYFVQTALHQTL